MKILLVRPRPPRESIGLQSFMICEPLELEYLCATLEGDGHTVVIIDMLLERAALQYFIKQHRPDIVGFTAYITHVQVVKDYAREVKTVAPRCVTVVGGVHAEVVPEDFLCAEIDAIVYVNGLATMRALVAYLAQGGTVSQMRALPGVWDSALSSCPIETTFDHPFPNRQATARYRKHYHYAFHNDCALLKTSFGCPYRCTFCFCIAITRHHYFERELSSVIAELRTIEERTIFIVDDNFLLKRDRVLEFCRQVREAGIDKRYIVFGRADFIVRNEDVVQAMADIGMRSIFVGIETYKEHELTEMEKRSTVAMNVQAIRTLESIGIECYGGILVGRDWDDGDFTALTRWLNSFKHPIVNIQPLTPMPGTPLYSRFTEELVEPRTRYGRWDLTHLLLAPTKISPRRYYYNILRTYFRTSASLRGHWYVLARYGVKAYLRCLWGSMVVTGQYVRLIMQPGFSSPNNSTLH